MAHRFHSTCGKNVAFQDDGCRALRVSGFCHGIVFSVKELKTGEVFEVRVWRGHPDVPQLQSGVGVIPHGTPEGGRMGALLDVRQSQ